MTELEEMPSSLNNACRKLDVALSEIEQLRSERNMLWQSQADLVHSLAEIERLRTALSEIANDPCLDPEGNRKIAMLALNPSQEGT